MGGLPHRQSHNCSQIHLKKHLLDVLLSFCFWNPETFVTTSTMWWSKQKNDISYVSQSVQSEYTQKRINPNLKLCACVSSLPFVELTASLKPALSNACALTLLNATLYVKNWALAFMTGMKISTITAPSNDKLKNCSKLITCSSPFSHAKPTRNLASAAIKIVEISDANSPCACVNIRFPATLPMLRTWLCATCIQKQK